MASSTDFPSRIYADGAGNAVGLFGQSLPGFSTQIWSLRFGGDEWSAAAPVQDDANEATDVDCQKYHTGDFSGASDFATVSPFTGWREKDPTDPTRFRIVTRQ